MISLSRKPAKCAAGRPSSNIIMRDKMAALSVPNVLMLSRAAHGAHRRTHALSVLMMRTVSQTWQASRTNCSAITTFADLTTVSTITKTLMSANVSVQSF